MADKIQIWNSAGILTDQWDDGTSTYTSFDPVTGAQTSTRAYTAAETAAAQGRATVTTANANLASMQTKAQNALTTNSNFLALASPTNAQVSAQVTALTRECSALIRILMRLLDTTAGT